MKFVPLIALVVCGCATQAGPPPVAPESAELPPQPDGPHRLLRAIDVTRAAMSLHYEWRASMMSDYADTISMRGEAVWTQGDVVFLRAEVPGAPLQAVSVGDRTWIYHEPTGEWPSSTKLGMGAAGRGPVHFADLLDVLSRNARAAVHAGRSRGVDTFKLRIGRRALEALAPEVTLEEGSEAVLQLKVEGGLIHAARFAGTLVLREGSPVSFECALEVRHVNEWYFLPFTENDPDSGQPRDVFHSPEVLAALEANDGIPPALRTRVGVWRDELVAQLTLELADERTQAIAERDFLRLGAAAVPALEKMRGVAAERLLERLRKR